MVLPLGGADLVMPEMDVPETVVKHHSIFWWLLVLVLLALTVGEIVSGDVFTAIFALLLTWNTWFMVRNSCGNMSQQCLLMYGLVCFLQAIFSTITLFGSLGGRQEQKTSIATTGDTTQYTTTVVTHPFFDKSQGMVYNIQSAMLIASPSVMALCMLMSWLSYSAFSTSLFDSGDDMAPVYGQGPTYNSYGGPGYSGPNYADPSQVPSSGGHRLGGNAARQVFQGQGQRLGA